MSPGPRRNFRNMGFHFLTPIFHFLSKPELNARLVAYSLITHTWAQKTHFDKNPKKFRRQNSLSKLSFDKKYWLNFLKFPFSSGNRRPKTRINLSSNGIFPLSRYLSSICIWPWQILTPESNFIHLPASCTILAHLLFTVGWQWGERALGYHIDLYRVEGCVLWFPISLSPHYQPTAERRCARMTDFAGRWAPGALGIGFWCCQFVRVADSQGYGMFKFLSKNYKFWYPLLSLSQPPFTVSEENHLDFCKNWVLAKFGWKIKILWFRNDFWVLFISFSGDNIKLPNFQIPLYFSSRVISISIGEHARN